MTLARFVRRISGSVYSGRPAKSSSAYSRMHTPSATRPHRPARWFALACEIGSIGSRCTRERVEYREMRAVPVSITYRMPGTVSDVSATFVASTNRRRTPAARPGSNTRCCSAAESRPNRGSTSVKRCRPSSARVVSRMSASVGRKTSTSPSGSSMSSSVVRSRASSVDSSRSGGRQRISTG
jgi:hypothetical protein